MKLGQRIQRGQRFHEEGRIKGRILIRLKPRVLWNAVKGFFRSKPEKKFKSTPQLVKDLQESSKRRGDRDAKSQ